MKLCKLLLSIPPDEVSFRRRGVYDAPEFARERPEHIGARFEGYHSALERISGWISSVGAAIAAGEP